MKQASRTTTELNDGWRVNDLTDERFAHSNPDWICQAVRNGLRLGRFGVGPAASAGVFDTLTRNVKLAVVAEANGQ